MRKIRSFEGGKSVNIMVDIGINEKTVDQAKDAGANWFVVSSGIFKSEKGIGGAFKNLQLKIKN